MKFFFSLLISQLPSILCLLIAGYLAVKNMSGWGWFIFAALMLFRGVKISGGDDDESKAERPAAVSAECNHQART